MYEVRVLSPGGCWEAVGSVRVKAGADGVVIRARRLSRIAGRVIDAEGQAVRCAVSYTQLRGSTGRRKGGGRTDNDGRFAIEGLRPGTLIITLKIGNREIELGEYPVPSEDLVLIAR